MPPTLALYLWLILVVGLLRYDPAKEPGTSPALWVPLIWLFFAGSRLPTQWLGGQTASAAATFESGSPTDRGFFVFMIFLGIGILVSRSFKWVDFIADNIFLIALLLFGLLSVLWSDFGFIAFKRWFRDLGSYISILVAVSDPHPFQAFRTLLRRFFYLLIPLSVLLVKYYPRLGRAYEYFSGMATYSGATTSKNMLGLLSLLSILFFFWDTLLRWRDRKLQRKILILNISFIAMSLWLMNLASSATSKLCLILGILVLISTQYRSSKHLFKVLLPAGICMYLLLIFGFGVDVNGAVAQFVGRDPTLTDRTVIWKVVLDIQTNPFIGVGYESFWLGPRLQRVWQFFPGINEAHSGYIQMYLQLGFVGLFLLICFLVSTYLKIWRRSDIASEFGPFSIAVWAILVFYNLSESAFGGGLLWLMLLLGTITLRANAPLKQDSRPILHNSNRATYVGLRETKSSRISER
jgi:O-antigen ligase